MSPKALELEIPTLLIGKAVSVRRRLRSLLRRVVKLGGWRDALEGLDFTCLNEAPGWIQIHGPMNILEGENVVVWLTIEEFWDAVPQTLDDSTQYQQLKRYFLEGLDYFWFSLCMLSTGGLGPLPFAPERDAERGVVALQALPKFLKWWEAYCELEPRFSQGIPQAAEWPEWGDLVLNLCRDAGATDYELATLQQMNPRAAGQEMRKWFGTGGSKTMSGAPVRGQ